MPLEVNQHMTKYEKLREKNIEDNKKMLESLGLLRTFKPIVDPIKKKRHYDAAKKKIPVAIKRRYEQTKAKKASALDEVIGDRIRKSLRVKGAEPEGLAMLPIKEDSAHSPKSPDIKHDNIFGPIAGIPVGAHWETRMDCSVDGVHRSTLAGIHGNASLGCYSIVLSGGFEDDIDLGDSFTYTGSGGIDLRRMSMHKKTKDQSLTKSNLALSLNVENRRPVRVVRGYKCQSAFAPDRGYRYDGLYSVEKCWSAIGTNGRLVWKYILKRIIDQAPPPWREALPQIKEHSEEDAPVEEYSYTEDIREEAEDEKTMVDEVNDEKELSEERELAEEVAGTKTCVFFEEPEYPIDEGEISEERKLEEVAGTKTGILFEDPEYPIEEGKVEVDVDERVPSGGDRVY